MLRILDRLFLYGLVVAFSVYVLNGVHAEEDGDSDSKPESEILSVRGLAVTNADGQPVVRLSATEAGDGRIQLYTAGGVEAVRLLVRSDDDGELRLYDESGVLRTTIGANDAGGYANFWNRSGDMAAYIGGDADTDAGYLSLWGTEKEKVVELVANERGGVFTARGTDGKKIASLGVANDTGTGLLAMARPDGKMGLALFTTDHGGQIIALNADGKKAAFLGVSAEPAGNGLLYLGRKDGKRTAEIGANSESGGYLSIRNSVDKRIIFMGASTGEAADDGVLEVSRANGNLGVVLRGYSGGSSVRVYDLAEKVKAQLR